MAGRRRGRLHGDLGTQAGVRLHLGVREVRDCREVARSCLGARLVQLGHGPRELRPELVAHADPLLGSDAAKSAPGDGGH